jgi:hypothetical protein
MNDVIEAMVKRLGDYGVPAENVMGIRWGAWRVARGVCHGVVCSPLCGRAQKRDVCAWRARCAQARTSARTCIAPDRSKPSLMCARRGAAPTAALHTHARARAQVWHARLL